MNKYLKNEFSLEYKSTIGADFLTKEIHKNNIQINLQIWDTAGTEKFFSMHKSYYRNTDICVLVFDLTDINSFQNLEKWRKDFIEVLSLQEDKEFSFILFGNKNDRINDIKVKEKDIKKYCSAHNIMIYYSVSAKDGNNINESFDKIGDIAYDISIKKYKIEFPKIKNINIDDIKNLKKKNVLAYLNKSIYFIK